MGHQPSSRTCRGFYLLFDLILKVTFTARLICCCVCEYRGLQGLSDREVACYTISCKNSTNIDMVIDWLVKHSKTAKS